MKRVDYIKKTRYENQLPPPPFAPKLVDYGVTYDPLLTAGSLSAVYLQSEILPEVDIELGIPIDLATCEDAFGDLEIAEAAMCPPEVPEVSLDPEDLELMGEAELSLSVGGSGSRSAGNSSSGSIGLSSIGTSTTPLSLGSASAAGLRSVDEDSGRPKSEIGIGTSFLRRTAYMTSDTRRSAKRKNAASEELTSADARRSRVNAELAKIEQSFVDTRAPLESLKHPLKRNLKAVSSTPLLPDAKLSDLNFVEVRLLGSASLHSLPKNQVPSREQLESSVFLRQKAPETVAWSFSEWLSFYVPESLPEAEELSKHRHDLRDTLSAEEAQSQEEKSWALERVQEADFTLLKPKQAFEEVVISHDKSSGAYFYSPISARANLRRLRVAKREEMRTFDLDIDGLDLNLRELTPQESIERDEVRSIYDPVKFG